MRLVRTLAAIPASERGGVVAIGNFDGVHRGHQALLGEVRTHARRLAAPAVVLTFQPHPRTLFGAGEPPFQLSTLRARLRRLSALGLDLVAMVRFDQTMIARSPESFAEAILAHGLGARHVVVGRNFRFGCRRSGDVETLATLGERLGFGVTGLEPLSDGNGDRISSTRVRRALIAGDPVRAAELIGAPWEIEGRVRHGDRIGRQIGVPTANIALGPLLRPAFGVYAVRVAVATPSGWQRHLGVANLGRRPTVAGTDERLEVHLLDTEPTCDLYGRLMRVALVAFIRPERVFDDLASLRAQIERDIADARRTLTTAPEWAP